MIGKEISHYTIQKKLGEGGMGVVYKARDNKLSRDVALKFLPDHASMTPENRSRFLHEAKSAAQLNHTNISQIYSIEEDNSGNQFIVMEYIDGIDLQQLIKNHFKYPDATAELSGNKQESIASYSLQIVRGLKAAHEKGITHRDIKPANIIVSKTGEIKILDFGLAKIADTERLTKDGSTVGTAAYMSPEQIQGEESDRRSDIWSFGVVLYEMVTGKLPFGGVYEHSVMYSIMNTDPPPIEKSETEIPAELESLIFRCLEKEPEERYQSAAELMNDLLNIFEYTNQELGSSSDARSSQYKSSESVSKKRKTILYAGVIGVLAVITVLVFAFRDDSQNSLPLPGSESIHLAVLPFTNIGDDPGRQVFSDGLVETITSNLSQLQRFQRDLLVVPAGELRNENITSASEAYKKFGVNYAIAGSLQPIADRLRLTVTLINTKNLRQINSAVIDVNASEVLELHNKSVENLLTMLNLELNPEAERAIREGNTSDPEAFELYLQGLGYLQDFHDGLENVELALAAYEEAVVLDPEFALAYAGLGQANWRKFQITREREWVEKAIEHAEYARNLNDKLVQVNITLGMINTGTGNYEQAIGNFRDALSTDAMNAEAHRGLARAHEYAGNIEEAESAFMRAIRLKPDYWEGYNGLGWFYYRHSEYEKAIEQFNRVIEITPDNYRGYLNVGGMYYLTENFDRAIAMFEHSLDLHKSYDALSNLGTIYYAKGQFEQAANMYESALEIHDRESHLWGNLATAYYWINGKRDQAIETYQKAIDLAREEMKINPNDSYLIIDLAGYEAVVGNENEARLLIEKALKLAPENSDVMFRAATTFERLGDRNEALAWIRKAIENGHSRSEIMNQPDLDDLISDERLQKILSE